MAGAPPARGRRGRTQATGIGKDGNRQGWGSAGSISGGRSGSRQICRTRVLAVHSKGPRRQRYRGEAENWQLTVFAGRGMVGVASVEPPMGQRHKRDSGSPRARDHCPGDRPFAAPRRRSRRLRSGRCALCYRCAEQVAAIRRRSLPIRSPRGSPKRHASAAVNNWLAPGAWIGSHRHRRASGAGR